MDDAFSVVLIHTPPFTLPGLLKALKGEKDMQVREISSTIDTVWRQVTHRSPDVTVIYSPRFSGSIKDTADKILTQSSSSLLLLSLEPIAPGLVKTDTRVYARTIWRPEDDSQGKYEDVCARVRALAHRKRSLDFPSSLPRTKAVRTVDADGEKPFSPPTRRRKSPRMQKERPPVAGSPPSKRIKDTNIIAIGASTGGTDALAGLFERLPKEMPGIVVVQHMPPGFTKMYADRLHRDLPFDVYEAEHDKLIKPGTIHIAPGDRQLVVTRRGDNFYTLLGHDQPVGGHCPAVNVLFDSVAECAGERATGIILTGMGADGALGLLKMRNMGAFTIGQDKESCVVYGMPMQAYNIGAVDRQAALDDIPALLLHHLSKKG